MHASLQIMERAKIMSCLEFSFKDHTEDGHTLTGGIHNKMKTLSSAPFSSNIRIDSEHIRHADLVRREIRSAHHLCLYICGTTPPMEGQFHPYHGFLPLQDTEGENINPYPTAFPYGNGMVLHFYQQQESSTTKTVHKVINKGLKTYV